MLALDHFFMQSSQLYFSMFISQIDRVILYERLDRDDHYAQICRFGYEQPSVRSDPVTASIKDFLRSQLKML